MSKTLILVSLSIILSLAIGCKKKNDNIGFTGNLFEPNIQANVSNAEVVLSAQVIESGTWNTNYTTLQTTTTDSEGKFEIEVESQKVSNYRLSFSKDDYFDEYYTISPDGVGEGEVFDDTYNLYSESTLVLNIKNIYPVDFNDQITYSIEGQTSSCSSCCSTSDKTFTGTIVDEVVTCKLPGRQTIKIEYYTIKDGNSTIHEISKFIYEFETKSIDINY